MNIELNLTEENFDEINEFYSWSRDYWLDISRSEDGIKNNVLNFGYWLAEGEDLARAQSNFFKVLTDMLGNLKESAHGAEIGCGVGGFAVNLLQKFPVNLTCYDILETHLKLSNEYALENNVADRLKTVQGSSMNMEGFSDNSLDFVYCIESSFHYDEKQKFFDGVKRVMKPGAIFVYADISCEDNSKIGFRSGNHFSSKQELETYISNSGFSTLEKMDIGPWVFNQLHNHIKRFNNKNFNSDNSGLKKPKVARYWELVSNNYAQLYEAGEMGYQIYKFQK